MVFETIAFAVSPPRPRAESYCHGACEPQMADLAAMSAWRTNGTRRVV
jgi:hypothetical protein